MKLRFIGTDGSMGLQHGRIYEVTFRNDKKCIVLIIKTGWLDDVICPYGSPQALAKNWSL